MTQHANSSFCIPAIRSFIPERLKPWIVIAFVLVIQFSGGIYLSSVSEMVGTTALMQEDILMAGYASLIGMALNFVVMFRLKCAVPPKTTFFICGIVIIAANLVCMYTRSVPLLVTVCFVAGFFRMWATFECNSTIQLWLTPVRDMSVFFSYVYLVVNGVIQLSGVMNVYLFTWAEWQYMQWAIIVLILLLLLAVSLVYRNYSTMPKIPLLGIDWLGMLMWGGSALCLLFIFVYGEHYDWFESEHIWRAAIAGSVLLALTIWRSTFIRHPFIFVSTFRYPIIGISVSILLIADILLAPGHIFEHILMENILRYDAINLVSLNWIALLGVVAGACFTWQTFAVRKWTYQTMLFIAFSCYTLYLAYFYFLIDYNLPKEMLMFPIFLRSAGYVVMAISLLTSLTRLPFPFHFFQGITIQNMFSAALGAAIGNAIVGHVLNVVMKKNSLLLEADVDHLNPLAANMPIEQLYGTIRQHALLVSMKEIYGWLLMLAISCLLVLLVRSSDIRPVQVIHPKFKTLRKRIRHVLKFGQTATEDI